MLIYKHGLYTVYNGALPYMRSNAVIQVVNVVVRPRRCLGMRMHTLCKIAPIPLYKAQHVVVDGACVVLQIFIF